MPAHLLGRHIARGAKDLAGFGECDSAEVSVCAAFGSRAASRDLGQAEVENLYPAVLGEEYVFRLQVAVNDAFFVRRRQPLRNLGGVVRWPCGEAIAATCSRCRRVSPSNNSQTM